MNLININNIEETQELSSSHGFIVNRDGKTKQYTGNIENTYTAPYIVEPLILGGDIEDILNAPLNSGLLDAITGGKEVLLKFDEGIVSDYVTMVGIYSPDYLGNIHYILFMCTSIFGGGDIYAAIKIPEEDVARWPFGWNDSL